MPLTAPRLDDRSFQDIVDEAKKRIPHYVKEWTDHNVSDPGVTLIELFAWMTETILYRMNQVPDLHYIKMLDLLGIRLQGPVPARAPVTFWLSAPAETTVVIPAGTEVASTRTETERSIIFTTNADFHVQPPQLAAVLTRTEAGDGQAKQYRRHSRRRLEAGHDGFELFSSTPQVDDALYFGFSNDLSRHLLAFEMELDPAGGAGVNPTMPPYVWEASTGERAARWQRCDVESDTTKALNTAGRVRIHLPQMGKNRVNDKSLYWIRARVRQISREESRAGMQPYRVSPKLRRLSTASWGGTTEATHAEKVVREFLGRSDGSTGQRFKLQRAPILERQPGEHLVVQVEDEPAQRWTEVSDFADSGMNDRHYTLDTVSGELRLGPAVREQDGTIKLYGAVPPRGANLVFSSYRTGGGQEGNVQASILNTLKTSIPFVARVSNRVAASGGLDAETLESAMMRAPKLLRSRERAVTESDYEFLARQALPATVCRVKCLQPRPSQAGRVAPGQVYVLVIPRVPNPARHLQPEELEPSSDDMEQLATLLDERRLLTTRLELRAPAYRWVACRVQLRAAPGASQETVETEVLKRLYRFLNPITGGPDGEGWAFGRELYISDVYQALQGLPNVQFVRTVEMRPSPPAGSGEGEPVESLDVVAHGLIASAVHEVEFV